MRQQPNVKNKICKQPISKPHMYRIGRKLGCCTRLSDCCQKNPGKNLHAYSGR